MFLPPETLPVATHSMAVKSCGKINRRIEGHTKRLKKTNDAFLRKFEKAENGVCMQLCKLNEQHAESMIRSSLYATGLLNPVLNAEPEGQRLRMSTTECWRISGLSARQVRGARTSVVVRIGAD
jgi:serine protease inhibitor ecotin